MAHAKTAVVLMLEQGATAPEPPDWYRRYFLTTTFGAGAYWCKQSNGALTFEGDVFGWYTFDQAPDFNERSSIVAQTLATANPKVRQALGIGTDLIGIPHLYDTCVIFIARVGNAGSGAGTLPVPLSLDYRIMSYVVLDTLSAFDFIAHELGHALNLSHSFNDTDTQFQSWRTHGGEYGHPYCIMSAMTYGGRNPTWTPISNVPLPRAMQRVPPSLNGWNASVGGWARKLEWRAGVDTDQVVELESIGSWPASLPKVLRVKGQDASDFAIEYRNRQDYYDAGLPSSGLVINHGTSGRASRAQGGGATFVSDIPLPLLINRSRSVYNNYEHNFAVEILDWKQSSVVLRVANGTVKPKIVSLAARVDEQGAQRHSMGTFDFTGAGIRCVSGVWPVTRVLTNQSAKVKLDMPDWPLPFVPRWWVNGQEIVGQSGTLQIATEVESPFPLPRGKTSTRTVQVGFIVKGPDEILLTNNPSDGNYSIEVDCRADFSVGTFNGKAHVDFEGESAEYPPEYTLAVITCLIEGRDAARPQPRQKIVLPQRDLPRPQEPQTQALLAALERLDVSPRDNAPYRQLFKEATGYPARRALVIPTSEQSLKDLGIRTTIPEHPDR